MALVERVRLLQYQPTDEFSRNFIPLLSTGATVARSAAADAGEREILADAETVRLQVSWTPMVKRLVETERKATHFEFRGRRHKIAATERVTNSNAILTGEVID